MTSAVATAPIAAKTDTAARFRPTRVDFKNFKPQHFLWQVDGSVATITLNRPERKNRSLWNRIPSCAICSATLSMPTISRLW